MGNIVLSFILNISQIAEWKMTKMYLVRGKDDGNLGSSSHDRNEEN